jgi:hypothetical protein
MQVEEWILIPLVELLKPILELKLAVVLGTEMTVVPRNDTYMCHRYLVCTCIQAGAKFRSRVLHTMESIQMYLGPRRYLTAT